MILCMNVKEKNLHMTFIFFNSRSSDYTVNIVNKRSATFSMRSNIAGKFIKKISWHEYSFRKDLSKHKINTFLLILFLKNTFLISK